MVAMILRTVILDLICEDCSEKKQFMRRSNRESTKAARRHGWYVKGERCLCPKHKEVQSAYRKREHGRASA